MKRLSSLLGYVILWTVLGFGIHLLHTKIQTQFEADRDSAQIALQNTARGNWPQALKNFDRAIAYRPDSADYLAYRSGVKVRLKDFTGALEDVEAALRLCAGKSCESVKAVAYLNKGEALLGLEKNEEAIQALTEGLKYSPQFAESYYFRGWAYRNVKDLKASEADFAQSKKLAYVDRGLAYQELAQKTQDAYRKNLIPSGSALKSVTLGFDRVLADFYWLAFVQYYGDRDACLKDGFRQAPSYLSLITELDPHFIQAYWFASFVIAGDLGLKKEAQEFLDRGIEMNKEDWTVPYIAGFNQYLYNKNEKRAAEYYKIAMSRPGAPAWLASQAKVFEEQIPSRLKKIRTWQKMYDESKDAMVKDKAKGMLVMLWSMVYRDAPNDVMRGTAISNLERLEAKPIPANQLPKEEN